MRYLDDDEIAAVADELDKHKNGFVYYRHLRDALDKTYTELMMAKSHGNSHHHHHHDDLHTNEKLPWHKKSLLCSLLSFEPPTGPPHTRMSSGGRKSPTRIPRDAFVHCVRAWRIPSPAPRPDGDGNTREEEEKEEEDDDRASITKEAGGRDLTTKKYDHERSLGQYMRSMSRWRRLRSYWAVHEPEIAFIAMVVILHVVFAAWVAGMYITTSRTSETFGGFLVVAKATAGALLPALVFLMLSMSRYLSTFLRRSYCVSRFINWDLSQQFHIIMAMVVLVLSTFHTAGHIAGALTRSSSSSLHLRSGDSGEEEEDVVPRFLDPTTNTLVTWGEYLKSPTILTGLVALGGLYLMCLVSLPAVRRWNHELFTCTHLLLYPVVGALVAHGSVRLFHRSSLDWFLLLPTAVILLEHATRLALSCRRIPATLTVLDNDVVEVRTTIPRDRRWRYRAGQYVFLQVPRVSVFQWHPFTVSGCVDRRVWLHIKTGGNWTNQVRDLAKGTKGATVPIEIGINGPFGAPAQRFDEFTHTIIVGLGIGVTPFSGILADLQRNHPAKAIPEDIDTGCQNAGMPPIMPSRTLPSSDASLAEENPKHIRVSLPTVRRTYSGKLKRVVLKSSSLADLIPTPCRRLDSSEDHRRVDFHWVVRDKTHLQWFSALLNAVSCTQPRQRFFAWGPRSADATCSTCDDGGSGGEVLSEDGLNRGPSARETGICSSTSRASPSTVDISMKTYITRSDAPDLITHVCQWLLEKHFRTADHPASHLTGLLNSTQLGRPDFVRIMTDHYNDMRAYQISHRLAGSGRNGERASGSAVTMMKVGVFYCGSPLLGEVMSDLCRGLTARGRNEGTKIEYHFIREVF